jgi:hypothetical protein
MAALVPSQFERQSMQHRETYLLRVITTEESREKESLMIRLQTVTSGEEHRFGDLATLMDFLAKSLHSKLTSQDPKSLDTNEPL